MAKRCFAACSWKFFAFLALSAVLPLFAFSRGLTAQEALKSFKVGLAVLKDNPDYHNARMAFVATLEEDAGMTVEFKLLDANGDIEVYREGLKKLADEDKVDLIFTTGTRSTQPAAEMIKDIPIIFTAVADPVGAGIVKSLELPGGNVTGTHCAVPAEAQVKTIIKVLPRVKKLCIVYTRGEANAEIQTEDFKQAAARLGLEVLTATVSPECKTEEEVRKAAEQLAGKVDVFIGHQDTSISRYGKGMIAIGQEYRIPTYVTLGQLLETGAVFSLGIDFAVLGRISGRQAMKILQENINPPDIPVDTDKNYSLTINLAAAKKIGLEIPIQVLKTATKILK